MLDALINRVAAMDLDPNKLKSGVEKIVDYTKVKPNSEFTQNALPSRFNRRGFLNQELERLADELPGDDARAKPLRDMLDKVAIITARVDQAREQLQQRNITNDDLSGTIADANMELEGLGEELSQRAAELAQDAEYTPVPAAADPQLEAHELQRWLNTPPLQRVQLMASLMGANPNMELFAVLARTNPRITGISQETYDTLRSKLTPPKNTPSKGHGVLALRAREALDELKSNLNRKR